MKQIAHILIATVIAWFLFCFFFFGMNAIVDSHFYWALGQYFITGKNLFPQGYQYAHPTTVSPPLYSLLLVFIPSTNILHAIQLLLLGLTGYCVYRSLKFFVSNNASIIIASLFILYPTNTIYTHYLLTETAAQSSLALLAYLLLVWTKTKKSHYLAFAILLSSVMTLLKYSFAIYAGLLLIVFFGTKHKKSTHIYIAPIIALCIIATWIWVNHGINGVWSLSDNRGGHLYNNAVWTAKLVPPKNSPSMTKLRTYVPESVDISTGYWSLQDYILPHVKNEWPAVDRILGSVALDAIRAHPLQYLNAAAQGFVALHSSSLPYWPQLGLIGVPNVPYAIFCGNLGSFTTCDPLIHTQWAVPYWNSYVQLANLAHRMVFPWSTYLLLFPTIAYSLIRGGTHTKLLILLYLLGVIPVAMLEHHDTRYLVPFYPIMAILGTYGASYLARSTFGPGNRPTKPLIQ